MVMVALVMLTLTMSAIAYASTQHDLVETVVVGGASDQTIHNSKADGETADISVSSLTIEYMENPMGVDKSLPRVSWKLDPQKSDNAQLATRRRRSITQKAYQLHVKVTPTSSFCDLLGEEVDGDCNCCGWKDCGWVESNQTHLVPFECKGITPLEGSDMDIAWKVSIQLENEEENVSASTITSFENPIFYTSDVATFRTALFSWSAKWITGGTMLRKEFNLPPTSAGLSYATLFVSGIGYYHVYIDGIKVGDHQLDPGWTDFSKRVWYSSYDVTTMLRKKHDERNQGDKSADGPAHHVISVILGNGWWSCGPPPGTNQPVCSEDPPQLILQLQVDGKPVLVTDTSWSVSSDSPVQYNSLYNGETYDARVAQRLEGWQLRGYRTASSWASAALATSVATKATLASQLFPPIRHISITAPVSIVVPSSDTTGDTTSATHTFRQVLDFGKNQAAVVHLTHVVCPRGTEITLRHAEVLMHPPYGDFDGHTLYTDNLRTAKATDRYICSGNPKGESYIPLFTQHGFRYVEITGLNYTLDKSDVEAVELHTDVKPTSSLHFTDPLLNQIQQMVLVGLKSNLMSVQTDCPQRDERRGWMGDAALTAEAAALSFNMGAFYTHWLDQMMDAQSPNDGAMPNFVPPLDGGPVGAPNWQSAYVMILWVLSVHYDDQSILYRHHESLVKYFYFLEMSYNQTGIANFREQFGDWCPPPPHPKAHDHLTGSFAFLGDMKMGIELFRNSPHPDAPFMLQRLTDLFGKAAPEFHDAFYNETTGVYMSGLQTEQALPLFLGVIPDEIEESILSSFVEDIEVTNGGHTTSGIVGIKYGMEALSMRGRGDVALDLALQTTYPSWGYMLNNKYEPSTTVWELWNSDSAGPGMNSRNHHMFGSVSSWFYKYVAGITPLKPGFARVQIKPNVLRLDGISAKVASPYGDIELFYNKLEEYVFRYDINLPPGTSGTFIVPIAVDDRHVWGQGEGIELVTYITESGKQVWSKSKFLPGNCGVLGATLDGNHVQLELTNGLYQFQVTVGVDVDVVEI